MTPEDAETVALQALVYLLQDHKVRNMFLDKTGLDEAALREGVKDTDHLAGILDYILSDENLFTNFVAKEPHFIGLGETLARKLWIKYQTGIYELLDNKDVEKLMFVRGVTEAAANALISGWKRYDNLQQIAWFDKHKIPSGIARNII